MKLDPSQSPGSSLGPNRLASALPPSDQADSVLTAERRRNAKLLNLVRALSVTLFLGLTLLVTGAKPPTADRVFASMLVLYWLLSLALLGVGVRFDSFLLVSSLAVPIVDMPLLFLVQHQGLAATDNPRSVASFTVGIFLCLIMLAAMSLRRSQIFLAAAVAAVLQLVLQSLAQDTLMGRAGGVLLLAFAASLCEFARSRRLEMIGLICGQQLRRERLARFFSPQVANHIEHEVDDFAEGQRCEVTVLFCDIREFTALSERMDGSRLVMLLNEFHGCMVETIFAHGGTLDKYTGDGVMAYFGAPLAQPDHAERAVRCALSMQTRLMELNRARTSRGEPPIRMGIGVHTGPAVVGSIGAPHRREFTVVGDTVNLASRLEQMTKLLEEPIIVSEATRGQAGDDTRFRRLGETTVRGKAVPIQTFVPLEAGP